MITSHPYRATAVFTAILAAAAVSAVAMTGCANPSTSPEASPSATSGTALPVLEGYTYQQVASAPHAQTVASFVDRVVPLPIYVVQDFSTDAAPFEELSGPKGTTIRTDGVFRVTSTGTHGSIAGSIVQANAELDLVTLQATVAMDPSSTGAGLLGIGMAGGDWVEFSIWAKGALLYQFDAAADEMVHLADHEFEEPREGGVAVLVVQMRDDGTVELVGTLDGEELVRANAPAAAHVEFLALQAIAGQTPTTVDFDDVLVTGLQDGETLPSAAEQTAEYAVLADGTMVADMVVVQLTEESANRLAAADPANGSAAQKTALMITEGGTPATIRVIAGIPVATFTAADGSASWNWHDDGTYYSVTSEQPDAGEAFVTAFIGA